MSASPESPIGRKPTAAIRVWSAWTDDGEIMGIKHQEYPVEGVQFHPESFMTQGGKELLKNFLNGGRR